MLRKFVAATFLFSLTLVIVKSEVNLKESSTISIQATNYTQVPSVVYIVDAVECLKEAYSIYEDDENRASVYAELFEEKHNGTWNVVIGYSGVFVQSSIYVETVVADNEKNSKEDKDSKADKLFLLFSTD